MEEMDPSSGDNFESMVWRIGWKEEGGDSSKIVAVVELFLKQ